MRASLKYLVFGFNLLVLSSCISVNYDITKPFGNYNIQKPQKAYNPLVFLGLYPDLPLTYNSLAKKNNIKNIFVHDLELKNEGMIHRDTVFRLKYTYSKDGALLKKEGVYDTTEFIYNDAGQLVTYKGDYEYQKVPSKFFYKNGFLHKKISKKRIITYFYKKDRLDYYLYENLKSGFKNHINVQYEKGEISQNNNIDYGYDGENRLINRIQYIGKSRKEDFKDNEYIYEYDDSGRVITESWIPHEALKTGMRGTPPSVETTKIKYLENEIHVLSYYRFGEKFQTLKNESKHHYNTYKLPIKTTYTDYNEKGIEKIILTFYTYEFYK